MTDIQLVFIGLGLCSIGAFVALNLDSPYKEVVTVTYSIILGFCSAVFFYVALFS